MYRGTSRASRALGGASLRGLNVAPSIITTEREWQKHQQEKTNKTKPKTVPLPEPIHYEPYELDEELDWQERARCQQSDPEMFFPEKGGNTNGAKNVCRNCLVIAECGAHAFSAPEEYGVWGGMSERERTRAKNRGFKPL